MTRDRRGLVLAVHVSVVALLGVLQLLLPPFHHGLVARIMVLAAYATGYNVLLGYTGLMSLGHAMFFAAGMYGTGLTIQHLGLGVAAGFVAGIASGLGVAGVVGLITLRTAGPAFLIVTMMLAQAFYLATLYFNEVTMGDQGFILAGLHVQLGEWRLVLADPSVKYNVALGVFAACLFGSLGLVRSPIGRVLVALRENEERTRLLGYNTARYRLVAVVVSGLMAAVAGAAYTLLFSYVGSTFAGILYSIYPLLWTLLGGAGTTLGPLIGTLLMTYLVDVTSGLTTGYLMVVGAVLVLTVVWAPAGLVGGIRTRWARWLP
ncbi:MAG: branched-chain amino acid ABC transporter permease [Candidatus Rokuibacteriota bacterium]